MPAPLDIVFLEKKLGQTFLSGAREPFFNRLLTRRVLALHVFRIYDSRPSKKSTVEPQRFSRGTRCPNIFRFGQEISSRRVFLS